MYLLFSKSFFFRTVTNVGHGAIWEANPLRIKDSGSVIRKRVCRLLVKKRKNTPLKNSVFPLKIKAFHSCGG